MREAGPKALRSHAARRSQHTTGNTAKLLILERRYERIPVAPFRVLPGAEAAAKEPGIDG